MNNTELQDAINKAREFLKLEAKDGDALCMAKNITRKQLEELEKIQVARANMIHDPLIRLKTKL
jgi:hypothetical protein